MEGPTNTCKVDGMSLGCMECCQKLTESPPDARKFDGSCQKVPRTHGKLTEIDGKSCGCMECSQNLTEGPADAGKLDRSFSTNQWMHVKFTEGPADVWIAVGSRRNKVDGSQ